MQKSLFEQTIRDAEQKYLHLEADQESQPQPVQQAAPQQGQPTQGQPDAAMPPQQQADSDQTQSQAGYGVYKDLVTRLLGIVSQFAGAIQSNDREQLTALQKTIPSDLTSQINQSISSITTAEPAKVAQIVGSTLDNVMPNTTATGA